MIAGLFGELQERIDRALTTAVLGAVAAAAGVAALFFVCVAIFVWTQQAYDTVTAAIVLAVLFVVIAAVALAIMLVARRRAAEAARRRARAQLFANPMLIATGVELIKALGTRRAASLALVGALAAGIWFSRPSARD
ncbi:MAG TPA: hypothetical protein VEM36_05650 [Xanthobacteraceae bacterium]|nr:hypothetical protein [Xanthobacteraceae bacterium]